MDLGTCSLGAEEQALIDRRSYSDVGLAESFADELAGEFFYLRGIGWFYWHETDQWYEDAGDVEILESAQSFVITLYERALVESDSGRREALIRYATDAMVLPRLQAIVTLARGNPRFKPSRLEGPRREARRLCLNQTRIDAPMG